MKLADFTPLHKKGRQDLKENYRPVIIISTLSNVFERIIFPQISAFLTIDSQNTYANFGKAIVLKAAFKQC